MPRRFLGLHRVVQPDGGELRGHHSGLNGRDSHVGPLEVDDQRFTKGANRVFCSPVAGKLSLGRVPLR